MDSCRDDPGVFIRSMASRGCSAALGKAPRKADVLAAFGRRWGLMETSASANELRSDIAQAADTTVVRFSPEGVGQDGVRP